ncbi:hypothetical protein Peur_037093 [Populus x canadensis]
MSDGTTINQRVVYEFLSKLCSYCHMPGHSSSACLNLDIGTEDLPTPALAKRADVSPSPSEDVAEPFPSVSCPIAGAVTRNREVDRRRKKEKLPPRDATSDLPVLSSPSNSEDSSGSDSSRNGKPRNVPPDPRFNKSKGRYPSHRTGLLLQDTSSILSSIALGVSAGQRPGNSCLWTAGQPPGLS